MLEVFEEFTSKTQPGLVFLLITSNNVLLAINLLNPGFENNLMDFIEGLFL